MGRFLEYLELSKKDNPIREWLLENGFEKTNTRDNFGFELMFPLIGIDRLSDRREDVVTDLNIFVSINFKLIRIYAKRSSSKFRDYNSEALKEVDLTIEQVTDLEKFKEVLDQTVQECINLCRQ